MDRLRPWALWLAVGLLAAATALCLGSSFLISPQALGTRIASLRTDPSAVPDGVSQDDLDDLDVSDFGESSLDPPGLGIPYLALPVGLLLAIVALMALSTVIGHRNNAILTGVVNLVGGIVGLIGGIVLAIVAFVALVAMVTLFLAVPFGTLAYLAVFGFFNVGASRLALGLLLTLQIAALVLLVVAQQRVLGNKRLMFFAFLAIGLTLLTLLLHSIVPVILVSITDALAALITAVVGAIWALLMVIGGIISLVKQLNLTRAGSGPVRQREPTGAEPVAEGGPQPSG